MPPKPKAKGGAKKSDSSAAEEKKEKRREYTEEERNAAAAKILGWLINGMTRKLYKRAAVLCEHLFADHHHQRGKPGYADGDAAFDELSVLHINRLHLVRSFR